MQRMSPFREVFENRVNNLTSEIESLKQENERLQAEIVRLSDPFLHAPDWAEWFAVDDNGYGYFYNTEPHNERHRWWQMEISCCCCGYYPELAANWENSKVKRVRELKP